MAEIDNLSIQIEADASRAEKAIQGLIDKLGQLNGALKLDGMVKFSSQLQSLADASSGIKELSNSIRSLSTAGSSLAKMTGLKTANDEMREMESTAKDMAKSIAKSFSFDLSGMKSYRDGLKQITDTMMLQANTQQKGKDNKDNFDFFSGVYTNILKEMSNYRTEVDGTYEDVKSFLKGQRIYIDESTRSWLQYLGIMKQVKSAFKEVSFDPKSGFAELPDIMNQFNGLDLKGNNVADYFQSLVEYLEDGAERAKKAIIHGTDQIKQGFMSEKDFAQEGEEIAHRVRDAFQKISEFDKVKNPFDGIVKGILSLQDIKLPDFSGLNTLANALERLSKISVSKIRDIAEALRGMSDTNGLSGVADSMSKLADSVNGVKQDAFSTMADGAERVGNSVALLTDRFHGFDQFSQSMETAAEMFDRIARSMAMEMFARMSTAFSSIDTTPLLEMSDAIVDVSAKVQDIESSAEPLEQTANEIAKAVTDSGISESLETVSENVANVVSEIEKANGSDLTPVAESAEKLADSAEKAEQKLSALEQSIKEILDSGFTQDALSSEMAKALSSIEELKQAIGTMEKHPEILDYQTLVQYNKELNQANLTLEKFRENITRGARIGGGFDEASKEAQNLQDRIYEIRRLMSDMDNRKIGIDVGQYRAWANELENITDRYDELMGKKKEVEKPTQISILANLVALGHEIGNIANAFDKLANYGIKGLRLAFKPLDMVIKEYKEKIEGIGEAFRHMADAGKKHLQKLSAFWKRSMKTFTFMLVRKAITAVLTEVGDAVKSLALWSKQFGTFFNDSMSHITSNLSYMARAIVGAFEPLINFIVPAFNALADAIARVAARLGEFFAAMTGQGYYMVAKKQVTDYAESVDKANKAQKNLIAGLDDLNIITTPTSTASGMDDVAAQWEKMDVSDKMKDWADKIKQLAKDLFDPIKKAWDAAGDHVINGWKYMTGEIKKLLADIGRDFMTVWKQPNTQKIFENILHTIGYIEEGIGHLARNFREAWNTNNYGLHILENIRDIILIITEHVKNMAREFRDWADTLDFKPLLKSFEEFTRKVQPLIDFIGNLMEEIWVRIILEHWRWLIEDGIPHLLGAIGRVIEAFNFDKILNDLTPVMDAFERLRQNLDVGIVNAFENIGKSIAKFANSEDFTKFTQNVAWFMDQITAERVEKLFTALGKAVTDVAEALMRFVGSDKFKDFMTKLFEWYDRLSVDDIAGFLKKIAIAIAAFKFAAFAGKGLAGFLSFLSVLVSGKSVLKILGDLLGGIGKSLSGIGSMLGKGLTAIAPKLMEGLSATLAKVGGAILKGGFIVAIVTGIAMVINNWDKIEPVLAKLADAIFKGLGMALGGLARFIGEQIAGALGKIVEYFQRQAEAVGGNIIAGILLGILNAIIAIPVWIADHIVKPFIDGLKKGFGIHSPAETMIPLGGYIIEGLLQGILGALGAIAEWIWTNVAQPIINAFVNAGTWLFESGKAIIQGLIDGIDALSGNIAKKWNEIKATAEEKWEEIRSTINGIVENIRKEVIDIYKALKQEAIDLFEQFKNEALEKFEELRKKAIEKFTELKNKAINLFNELRNKVVSKMNEMKNTVLSLFETLKNTAISIFNNLRDGAIQLFSNLRDTAVQVFNNLKDSAISIFTNLYNGAVTLFNNLLSSASSIFSNIRDTIVGFASSAAEEASHAFWNLVDWASDAFWSVVNAAGSILGNIGSVISGALSGVKGAVQDAFYGAKDWLTGVGNDIVSGLTGGISSATKKNTFFNNTASLGQAVTNITRGVLKSSSPSRVFMDIGKDVVDGLDIGIEKNAKDSEKIVKDWMKDLTNISVPQFDFSQTLPKDKLTVDAYQHTDVSGIATVDGSTIQQSVRSGVMDAVGGLLLPILNDIASSSRETANKEFGISETAIGKAATRYARDYQTRTGRPAYGY